MFYTPSLILQLLHSLLSLEPLVLLHLGFQFFSVLVLDCHFGRSCSLLHFSRSLLKLDALSLFTPLLSLFVQQSFVLGLFNVLVRAVVHYLCLLSQVMIKLGPLHLLHHHYLVSLVQRIPLSPYLVLPLSLSLLSITLNCFNQLLTQLSLPPQLILLPMSLSRKSSFLGLFFNSTLHLIHHIGLLLFGPFQFLPLLRNKILLLPQQPIPCLFSFNIFTMTFNTLIDK